MWRLKLFPCCYGAFSAFPRTTDCFPNISGILPTVLALRITWGDLFQCLNQKYWRGFNSIFCEYTLLLWILSAVVYSLLREFSALLNLAAHVSMHMGRCASVCLCVRTPLPHMSVCRPIEDDAPQAGWQTQTGGDSSAETVTHGDQQCLFWSLLLCSIVWIHIHKFTQ